jgi:transcription initiation factor IIE alpha subunit
MRTKPGADESFRRPITLPLGKFQFSEEGLADDWKLGRKRVRRIIQEMSELRLISTSSSRTASSGALDCVASWVGLNGKTNSNASKTSGRG